MKTPPLKTVRGKLPKKLAGIIIIPIYVIVVSLWWFIGEVLYWIRWGKRRRKKLEL